MPVGTVQVQMRIPVDVAEAMERVTGTRYGAKQNYLLGVIRADLQRRGELPADNLTSPLPFSEEPRRK